MKRIFDLSLVIMASPIWVPVLLLVALWVRFRLGSPVFFTQERPGLRAKSFELIKFRTMTDQRDEAGNLLSDTERLTPFGQWLRSTSLDELPELWNVLRGEMSLVGPRPLLKQYVPLYSKHQFRRHDVLPGVTGWAQVNGRNAISWEEKFDLDVHYVDHHSLFLDIKILWMTIMAVFRRHGIQAPGDATMPVFEGSKK
ncbi:MAG: sugar transferase [Limisphaerales bacterium]